MTEETILRIAEIKEEMKSLRVPGRRDIEVDHITADDLLCELIRLLGHGEIVDDFEELELWYA